MVDDRELWVQIRRGDVGAFDKFYRESAPRLHTFLRQILREAQAAEDVTQETFVQLWQRPNGFRPEKGSLRAYVFGIGRKRAAEWWRRRGPDVESPRPETAEDPSAEAHSLVADALSRMDTGQQALLWLREVEGQSYAELAETLEIPLGTVKSRLFAAREELRRIWHSRRTEEGENP